MIAKDNTPGTAGVSPAVSLDVSNNEDNGSSWLRDRRYLPHCDNKRIQLITIRLGDSVPKEVIDEWKFRTQYIASDKNNIELRKFIDKYEDSGAGQCHLRDKRIAELVRKALYFFDGKHYKLIRYCIMPNHVHILVETFPEIPLSSIVHSWCSYTAHKANKILGRTGTFWMREYHDRYIRDEQHYRNAINYIDNNPVKAGLAASPEAWPWGSAGDMNNTAGETPAFPGKINGTPAVPGILLFLLLLFPIVTNGQHVRLAGDDNHMSLYFDFGRLWSYNLYEHSRWGGGLEWRVKGERWNAENSIYLGYSGYAKLWSGGATGKCSTPAGDFRLGVSRDLAVVGSRSPSPHSFSDLGSLSVFMTRRMSERHTLAAGYGRQMGHYKVDFGLNLFHGYRLYDGGGLLYAKEGDVLPREDGWESVVSVQYSAFSAQCKVGGVYPEGRGFLRLIGQYENQWYWNTLKTSAFAQSGIVNSGAPYPYLFDLGGTWGAPFCFNRCLLTAAPNEFTADLYLFASVRLETSIPLFKYYDRLFAVGCVPVPFVGLNAAWGLLRGMDADGMALHDGLMLQAPYLGIIEPVVGIDGLLRWGVVDWGLAAAYRIVPYGASYHHSAISKNLSLMVTARLFL